MQGSTRALTNTGGSLVATYTYDPYGNVTGKTGTASAALLYNPNTRMLRPDSSTFALAQRFVRACNANPLVETFWTEGNCISESPLNPIPYYEKEIEAIRAGCSYWEAVQYGLQGAAV